MEKGSLSERIGIQDVIIRKACSLAMSIQTSVSPTLHVDKPLNSSYAIFAFSGSWSIDDWYTGKSFGESKINRKLFPSLKRIGNGETAHVNQSFLQQFETVLTTSNLQEEVRIAFVENKQMVFTGHSSGAPIAILATIWLQEQQRHRIYNQFLPFCITFGSPLIGDRVFGHALRREWSSDRFIHVITGKDIIPRILLAPLSSIEKELPGILHFFNPNSMYFGQDSISRSQEASVFFSTITRNASYAASHAASLFMGCTNPLLEVVTSFAELSPYRPFGTYLFCTGNRKLVMVKNPEAVLQLLFYSLQMKPGQEVSDVACKSLEEHLVYNHELQESFQMQDVLYLDDIDYLRQSTDESDKDEKRLINTALKDLGLSARARICIGAAGELEKQKHRNKRNVEHNMIKIQEALRMLELYQATCEVRELGYYDAFKLQKEYDDFNANLKRLELAGMWDGIKEMLDRNELPDDFEVQSRWVDLGTKYRRTVEPLDIANYYRHSKDDDSGHYMAKGRPGRYRYTQRWLEHASNLAEGSCADLCFWAKVEELCCDVSSGKTFEEVKDRVLGLEREVLRFITSGLIARDVFLEESTFVKWWRTLPIQHRVGSCIAAYMNGDGSNLPNSSY